MRISANLIICRNEGIYKTLRKFGFPKNKLTVIDTGVDFYKVYNHKILKKYNFDGVFLGRLHFLKGIFDLPKIWFYVTQELPEARLAVIGSGNTKTLKSLNNKIKALGVSKNIKILGPLVDSQMLDILKTAKVFLFTDYEAGFSLATSEAMAAGIPVVAYDLPIFGSIYKKGFIKVPKGNKKLAAKAIIKLLNNKELREALGRQGVEQARELDRKNTEQDFLGIINNEVNS